MRVYEADSPEKLSVLLKDGDHHAFTEIFHRYNTLLYSHVYNKLRDAEQARDIVHEVFFSLWSRREKIEVNTSLLAYLFAATRYKVADFLSHKQVQDKHIASLQAFIETHGQQQGADYRARENQLRLLIEQEIAALPPRMQQIFRMSRFDQFSHKEIASALQLSEETVKDQVKKALRILRGRLGVWALILLSVHDL